MEGLCLAFHVAEAGSVQLEEGNPAYFQLAHKLWGFSALLHVSSLAWTGRHFIKLALPRDPRAIGFITIALAGGAFVLYKLMGLFNATFSGPYSLDHWAEKTKTKIPLEEQKDIQVYWTDSNYQRLMEAFYFTEIILNAALAVFTSSRVLPTLSAATQIYSLYKTAQWKWLAFDRTLHDRKTFTTGQFFWDRAQDDVFGYKVSYQSSSRQGCTQHGSLTLIDDLYQKSCQFLKDVKNFVPTHVITRTNGVKSAERMDYAITLSTNQKLDCQVCQEELPQNNVYVSVWHKFNGMTQMTPATIKWIKVESNSAKLSSI